MKQVMLIAGSVISLALVLALYVYWKNGQEPQQHMASTHATDAVSNPTQKEQGDCPCNVFTPIPETAAECLFSTGPYHWSFSHVRPYAPDWMRADTFPLRPYWVHPPIRDNFYGPSHKGLAVK